MHRPSLLILALMAAAPFTHAQSADEASTRPAYVSVSVEINGLEESTVAIRDTMRAVSQTLDEIVDERGNLSAEEIEALGSLIEKSDDLVVSLERTIKSVPAMIESAREPSRGALADWLSTTSVQAVDPAIRLASREVKTWLRWLFAMAVGLLILAGLGLYISARELRQMARVLRSLADDYEIVPRERESTPAGP
ncbi:MAG: hypothetical protein AAFU65_11620 [Pseudomonadota bacterium]